MKNILSRNLWANDSLYGEFVLVLGPIHVIWSLEEIVWA